MTAKRKLKRRVRERQARTGESYVTARRRVVETAPERSEPAAPRVVAVPEIELVELIDATPEAAKLGFRARVGIYPSLAGRIDPATAIAQLRDAIMATSTARTARLFGLAFGVKIPDAPPPEPDLTSWQRVIERARAGIGGASDDGSLLALFVNGRDGIVPVICTIDAGHTLVLRPLDEHAQASPIARMERERQLSIMAVARVTQPTLVIELDGRDYPVRTTPFVIGRDREVVDLAIKDGMVSRVHAAVIRIGDNYFLKDIGSLHGILYKGVRVPHKRIEDGDVFHIGSYELRFTYRSAL